jgi:glycosyltransferase involved in cell wall biosynthesis
MTASAAVAYALTKYQQPSQTFVENEIRELRRRGVDVRVVSVERGEVDRSDDDRVRYLDDLGDRRAWLPHHRRWAQRSPRAYARFLREVVRYRSEAGSRPEQLPWWRLPAVATELRAAGVVAVHAHFGWSGATAAACLGALLGVPWSVTLHAKDIFAKRQNLAAKVHGADVVVTVCDYNRRWMATHLDLTRPMQVLTCGVEAPADDDERPKEVDVVTVGRLIPKKGVDTLLRAAARLDPVPSVEVVGDGPERAALEALASALGIAASVRFRGSLSHDEALDRIRAGRVFCLPCRLTADGDRDAVPTVIVEAMMRGVPVVATDVVGIPELVGDDAGILVPPDDDAALAAALRELLGDPGRAAALGKGGAERARAEFEVGRQTERLATLLGVPLADRR